MTKLDFNVWRIPEELFTQPGWDYVAEWLSSEIASDHPCTHYYRTTRRTRLRHLTDRAFEPHPLATAADVQHVVGLLCSSSPGVLFAELGLLVRSLVERDYDHVAAGQLAAIDPVARRYFGPDELLSLIAFAQTHRLHAMITHDGELVVIFG